MTEAPDPGLTLYGYLRSDTHPMPAWDDLSETDKRRWRHVAASGDYCICPPNKCVGGSINRCRHRAMESLGWTRPEDDQADD